MSFCREKLSSALKSKWDESFCKERVYKSLNIKKASHKVIIKSFDKSY